jgi:hypothetical protein
MVPFGIIFCALVLLHHYSRRCHITLNTRCIILYSYDRAPSNIVKTLKTILRASRSRNCPFEMPQKIADQTVCPYSSIDSYHFRPTFSLDSTFKFQSLFLKTIFTRSTAPSHYRTCRLTSRSMPQTIGLKGKDDLSRFYIQNRFIVLEADNKLRTKPVLWIRILRYLFGCPGSGSVLGMHILI